jgi:hypothetical protein
LSLSKFVPREPVACLVFAPLAWLKLMMFLHAGDTEVGGFAVSSADDPLYVDDLVLVRQMTTPVSVEFDDAAVADCFDRCVDAGLPPRRFGRIWCHTHPGECPRPSGTDERTFARAFGRCDWSVMFIVGRTGRTYARLAFAAGPGGSVELEVAVDWATWPQFVLERQAELPGLFLEWVVEFEREVQPVHTLGLFASNMAAAAFPRLATDEYGEGGGSGGWWGLDHVEEERPLAAAGAGVDGTFDGAVGEEASR